MTHLNSTMAYLDNVLMYYAIVNQLVAMRALTATGSVLYNQTWDAENRLKVVTDTVTGEVTKFIYDGDGNRVLQVYSGTYTSTTIYLGSPAEITILGAPLPPPTVTVTIPPTMTYRTYLPLVLGGQAAPPRTQPLANETWKMYYAVGNQLVAMRVLTATGSTLYYLRSDHLGSTSAIFSDSGAKIGEMRYRPYGEIRYTWGISPTNIGFTGQRLDATGLMFYQARYYSQAIGRFVSADTIVPDFSNPQSLNRFSYVRNNPLKYVDPSGHREIECDPGEPGCGANGRLIKNKKSTLPRQFEIGKSNNTRAILPPDKDAGYICSPAALFVLLRYYGLENDLNNVLDAVSNPEDNALKPGALDPVARAGEHACPNNRVCTSLQVIEAVAEDYAGEENVIAGEHWTKERIMQLIAKGIPVMINYGGGGEIGYGHSVVIYGYDLDVGAGGTFKTLDPLVGGPLSFEWNTRSDRWSKSDYGDPLRLTTGGKYAPYHNWALAIVR